MSRLKLNHGPVDDPKQKVNGKQMSNALAYMLVSLHIWLMGIGNVDSSYCHEGTMLTLASVKSTPVQLSCATP